MMYFLLAACTAGAEQRPVNYDESAVGEVTLPELLRCSDGTLVRTVPQWEQRRRPEILGLFQDHVYGRIQPPPGDLRWEVTATRPDALGGKATRKLIHVWLAEHPAWRGMDVMLHVPNGARGRVPFFVGLSFNGNQAVTTDRDVPVSERWVHAGPAAPDNRATEASRGAESSRWSLGLIMDHGFAVASAYYGDIEPDHPEGWKEGVRAALSPAGVGTVWRDGDWGAIGAWAWGLSRILDCLGTEERVDTARAVVIGHSRLGKTALWAGASDPRFAIVISNNSGEGGAALMRRNFGETTEIITRVFPHWFTSAYRRYANNENACPVDQHMLIALMAPRPVYIASAAEDAWADPKGEFLSGHAAGPAYALYGRRGVCVDAQPPPDQPVGDCIGYHIRTGKHDVTPYDWEQYLRFAERHFAIPAREAGGQTRQ